MSKLGKKVRDTVSGFQGVATHRHEAWRGVIWYTVVSTELHDGKIVEEYIDEWRLQELDPQ